MDPRQLERLIRQVLRQTPWYSAGAVTLLCMTAATESLCGRYLFQEEGPARGIFQVEPATALDIFRNFLAFRPQALEQVERFRSPAGLETDLTANLAFQAVLARVHYLRDPKPIPGNLAGMARTYKRVWNTPAGKGSAEKALADFKRFFGWMEE